MEFRSDLFSIFLSAYLAIFSLAFSMDEMGLMKPSQRDSVKMVTSQGSGGGGGYTSSPKHTIHDYIPQSLDDVTVTISAYIPNDFPYVTFTPKILFCFSETNIVGPKGEYPALCIKDNEWISYELYQNMHKFYDDFIFTDAYLVTDDSSLNITNEGKSFYIVDDQKEDKTIKIKGSINHEYHRYNTINFELTFNKTVTGDVYGN